MNPDKSVARRQVGSAGKEEGVGAFEISHINSIATPFPLPTRCRQHYQSFQLSVRNGVAGMPAPLYRLNSGLSAHA